MEYFPNPGSEIPFDAYENIRETLQLYVLVLKSNSPLSLPKQQTSTGEQKNYSSLYIGYGGKLFTFWKLSQSFNDYHSDYDSMLRLINQELPSMGSDAATFYMGKQGLLSILAVSSHSEATLRVILDSIPLTYTEFELLYGAAGALYTLGFISKNWPDNPYGSEISQKIRVICKSIVDNSERTDVLLHKFPRGNRGKNYLGAAHGVIGIVHVMLQVRGLIPHYDEVLKNTVDFVISLQLPSGNFPVSVNSTGDDTLHFCHGSPGAVPMLCLAYKAYGEQRFLDSALKAAEDLWVRGLLRKGRGLCHGVSGNGYSFLHLYNTTGEEKWLHRAQMFALIMGFDEDYDKSIKSYDDPQRMRIGEADHPYSLMEGISGSICFLKDCLEPGSAGFPGYDF